MPSQSLSIAARGDRERRERAAPGRIVVEYDDDLQAGAAALLALLRAPHDMASSPKPHDDHNDEQDDEAADAA